MAKRGQFKRPVEPLEKAFQHAMDAIGSNEEGVALFMVAGEIMSTKRTSQSFENNVQRLANNLIGVYDIGADARVVREDIELFYQTEAVWQT